MGLMRILDATGDTVVEWDTGDAVSVVAAEREFDRQLHQRQRVPFARRAGEAANRARPLLRFDPAVEEIVWTVPVTGG